MPSANSAPWMVTVLGDCALQVHAKRGISPEISGCIHQLARTVAERKLPELLALVPAFDSLTLRFSPRSDLSAMRLRVIELCGNNLPAVPRAPSACVEIPVELEFGPDLAALAEQLSCTPDAALSDFCSHEYLVAQIGFQPGFPYLLGLPGAFAMPRRSEPRTSVRPGSIAIGGSQAGIYPGASPGGWNIIAYTKQVLFNPHSEIPCLLKAGDRIRFVRKTEISAGLGK